MQKTNIAIRQRDQIPAFLRRHLLERQTLCTADGLNFLLNDFLPGFGGTDVFTAPLPGFQIDQTLLDQVGYGGIHRLLGQVSVGTQPVLIQLPVVLGERIKDIEHGVR